MNDFFLIAGPCALESEEKVMFLSQSIKEITDRLGIEYYFKVSWDKANRTSASNFRGPGLEEGVKILQRVKTEVGVKICTDIHEPYQAKEIAKVADIIQIPAFLCRQTDLLKAACETGKKLNIKKAQFLSPEEMIKVIGKCKEFGHEDIMLCERGTAFGYNNLVVDMTGLVRMKRLGRPVVFDATHSVQVSGGGEGFGNSGNREYVPYMARAAMATGTVDGLFLEVHDNPDKALCDGSCMLRLDMLERLLRELQAIKEVQDIFNYDYSQSV